MRFLLLALLVLSSCKTPSNIEPKPLSIYSHTTIINEDDFNYTAEEVDILIHEFSLKFQDYKVIEAFKHLTIIFTNRIPEINDGLTYNHTIILIKPIDNRTQLSKTALPHELLHVALFASTGDSDSSHTSDLWISYLPKVIEDLYAAGM